MPVCFMTSSAPIRHLDKCMGKSTGCPGKALLSRQLYNKLSRILPPQKLSLPALPACELVYTY